MFGFSLYCWDFVILSKLWSLDSMLHKIFLFSFLKFTFFSISAYLCISGLLSLVHPNILTFSDFLSLTLLGSIWTITLLFSHLDFHIVTNVISTHVFFVCVIVSQVPFRIFMDCPLLLPYFRAQFTWYKLMDVTIMSL